MKQVIWISKIVILGAGDRGSATACRLFNCGFRPILIEEEHPSDLFYFRNFSDVVYLGNKTVNNVECQYLGSSVNDEEIRKIQHNRSIPCVTLADPDFLSAIKPEIIIDCRQQVTEPSDLQIEFCNCLIRSGNRWAAGRDAHFVISDSGPFCGRILSPQHSESFNEDNMPDTVNAPLEGVFTSDLRAGDRVSERQIMGQINQINILAPDHGILLGRLHSGHYVKAHQPIFKIAHRLAVQNVDLKIIPHINYAIAGGILEAVLVYLNNEYNLKEREKTS